MPKPIPKPYPMYATFPGNGFFRLGQSHPIVAAMMKRLAAEGYRGSPEASPEFSRSVIKAYAWYQKKLGYTGRDAAGYPDKKSWDSLKVPQV